MTDVLAEELLETRVSALLERSPKVLPCLIKHGFTPLGNPLLRKTLAPTVTLAQAIKLRGLSEQAAQALLGELAEVVGCR